VLVREALQWLEAMGQDQGSSGTSSKTAIHCENFARRNSVVCAACAAQGKPMRSAWNVPQSHPVCCALKSNGKLKDFQSRF
jgi:hypothetical protein